MAWWLRGGVGPKNAGWGDVAGTPVGCPCEASGRGDGVVQWLVGRVEGAHGADVGGGWVPGTPITGVDVGLQTSGVVIGVK